LDNFKDIYVEKPWGYEYLVYENRDVALWLLYIKEGESTSLHNHPKKTTGLVLLNGKAQIDFINDSKIIESPKKEMFRRGLFHKTTALSDGGVFILEIETPNDKKDLVRLDDTYGRVKKGYEKKNSFKPKEADMFWIDENEIYNFKEFSYRGISFFIYKISKIEELLLFKDTEIIMFLRGGLYKDIENEKIFITVPGDIGVNNIIKQVANNMDSFSEDTLVLTLNKKL
jgi:mannose-6-phosphate isomerase-like protein (cupin superfamily)|tara:strand:- start:12166 stop:12849 length:684 start_codon:yes stop_codon:yes gene_type:complete